ncbi:hypothetical protein BDQ17DRAFT_367478 [Cyathus striatus]|nr:hypothetical protein BDQ17DRAFT_367478 [Cyathus striatus]
MLCDKSRLRYDLNEPWRPLEVASTRSPSRRKSWRSVQKRSRRSIENVPGSVGSLSDGGEFERMPRRPSSVPLPGDYGFGGTHQAHLIPQYTTLTHSASEDQAISASSAPVISFSSLLPSPNRTSCSLGCASRWIRTHSPKKTHPSSTWDSSPASAFRLTLTHTMPHFLIRWKSIHEVLIRGV